jgi:predicted Zn-dependent protease with MMP-like domain
MACGVGHNGPVIAMSAERFEELVEAAFARIPEELIALLDNVVLFVEDDPPSDDPHLLGLYSGIPQTERGWSYGGALPDRIFVYRNPTLAICDTEEDVIEEVEITVAHEIAHHFGIDDARLHELGYG